MNISQFDAWILQLAAFFVTRYEYTTVAVQQAKDEIWLVNPKQVTYPVIRLTKTALGNNYFDSDRIGQIHRAILDMFHREGKRLEFHAVIEEEEETIEDGYCVTIHPGWVPKPELMSMFSGLGGVVHMVENPQAEYVQLSKLIERHQMEAFKKNRKQHLKKAKLWPYVSITVGVICVVVFLLSLLLQLVSSDSVAISIFLGSYYKAFIVGLNEWFRLLTSGFVHIDIFHLLMNLMALYYVGVICEQVYGHQKYAIILLGSIVIGNVFVFIGNGNIVAMGLSGGLYGLMAALLVYFVATGMWQQPMLRRQFLNILFINLLISFMPGISMLAHLGGFVGGVFLSMVAIEKPTWKALQKNFVIAFLALCIALGVLMGKSMRLNDKYYGTDLKVAEIAERLHLDFYSDHIAKTMGKFYRE